MLENLEHKDTLTRLACCVVIALILCYGAEHLSGTLHLELLERYLPWLEQNRIQAVAVVAAILFGISLVVFPLPESEHLAEPDPISDLE